MTLSLDTAYRSFGGEVEASSTPTICRPPDSRRHQFWAIARTSSRHRSRCVSASRLLDSNRSRCTMSSIAAGLDFNEFQQDLAGNELLRCRPNPPSISLCGHPAGQARQDDRGDGSLEVDTHDLARLGDIWE